MSEGSGFNFYNSLVGDSRTTEISKDGKSVKVTGEIADGINGTFNIRPSNSSGTAVDFEVGEGRIIHIEGDSKSK